MWGRGKRAQTRVTTTSGKPRSREVNEYVMLHRGCSILLAKMALKWRSPTVLQQFACRPPTHLYTVNVRTVRCVWDEMFDFFVSACNRSTARAYSAFLQLWISTVQGADQHSCEAKNEPKSTFSIGVCAREEFWLRSSLRGLRARSALGYRVTRYQ